MLENENPTGTVMPPTLTTRSGFWDSSPKTMFFMGLFLGLAVASTVGLGLVLGSLWSGHALGATVVKAADANPTPTPTPTPADNTNPTPTPAKPVAAVDVKTDHIRGSNTAKVTLIEYSDFQCPYCRQFEATLTQVLKDFPKDVRLVFRQFPLTSIHQYAEKAAEASECAAKLGGNDAFWKMHDELFAKAGTGDLTTDVLKSIAKDLKLDTNKFNTCLDSGEMKAKIDASFATGNDSGVEGTPATFVNGKLVSGALPYDSFKPGVVSAGAKQ